MALKCAGDWGRASSSSPFRAAIPTRGAKRVLRRGRRPGCAFLDARPGDRGGCGDEEVDARLFPAVAEAAGRPVFLSHAEEKNHRLVAGAALAYGHGVVSWSPIDINMAKQMNLLLADLGFPPDRVLIDR